jgi:hypothetical protein
LVVYQGARSRRSRTTGGVVAGEVVPDDHDALGVETERDGAFHGALAAVAGFADAGGVLGVAERDLDGPAGGVSFHDRRGRGGQVGGDQREAGFSGFDEDQYPHGAGAEHAPPQTPLVMNRDGGRPAITGDGDWCGGHRGGQVGRRADPGAVDPGPSPSPQPRRVVQVGMDVPEAGVAAQRPGQRHVRRELA